MLPKVLVWSADSKTILAFYYLYIFMTVHLIQHQILSMYNLKKYDRVILSKWPSG